MAGLPITKTILAVDHPSLVKRRTYHNVVLLVIMLLLVVGVVESLLLLLVMVPISMLLMAIKLNKLLRLLGLDMVKPPPSSPSTAPLP